MYSNKHRNYLLWTITTLFPFLLLLGLVLGFGLAVAIGQPGLAIVGFVTVGPPFLVTAAFLFYLMRNWETIDWHRTVPVSAADEHRLSKLSHCVFFLTIAFAVLSLTTSVDRPFAFFLALTVLYVVVFARIFLDTDPRIVLLQALVLLLLSTFSVTLKYPIYYGYTDILGHIQYATYVVETGTTVPGSLSYLYEHFPLFHILVATGSNLFDVPTYDAWRLLAPFIFGSTVLVTYKLSTVVLPNPTVALVAAAFYTLMPNVAFYSQYFITRTAAFVGFAFVLFLLFRPDEDRRTNVLILVFTVYLLLVHQVTVPQVLVLFGALLVGLFLSNAPVKPVGFYAGLLTVLALGYWLYVAYPLTEFVVVSRVSGVAQPDATVTGSTDQRLNSANFYLHNYTVILLALIGLWSLLREKASALSYAVGFFLLFTAPIYIPSPLSSLWITNDLLRFDRFALMLSPFVAILLAVGLHLVSKVVPRGINTVVILALVTTFAFTAVTAGSVAPVAVDSGDVSWTDGRNHFTESEVRAASHVREFRPAGESNVYTDHPSERAFNQFYRQGEKGESELTAENMFGDIDRSLRSGSVFFRSGYYRDTTFTIGTHGDEIVPDGYPRDYQPLLESTASKTYESNSATIYSDPRRGLDGGAGS